MAIEKFEEGHWYRWIGPKETQPGWDYTGGMDFILDGKLHACCYGSGFVADFVGNEIHGGCLHWNWVNGEYFEEVPSPVHSISYIIADDRGEEKIVPLSHMNVRRYRILESLSIDQE